MQACVQLPNNFVFNVKYCSPLREKKNTFKHVKTRENIQIKAMEKRNQNFNGSCSEPTQQVQ